VALLDTLLGPIEALFNRVFGGTVVGRLVAKIKDGVTHILTLVDRIQHLIESVKSEVAAFASWREDIRFRTRVVSIPAAVQKTQDLIQGARDSWAAIVALMKDFREKAIGENPTQAAEEVGAELEAGSGESLLKRLPRLSKGLEKLLGVVSLIVDAVISWSDAVDKLQTIVDEVTRLREAIEKGDLIFLKQSNPRRIETLSDGTKIKIRVGSLHQ
jgi:hypothetical protein